MVQEPAWPKCCTSLATVTGSGIACGPSGPVRTSLKTCVEGEALSSAGISERCLELRSQKMVSARWRAEWREKSKS